MKRKKIFTENYQPMWLPQITADYGYVLKNLDDQGIKYSFVTKSPNELKPLQKTVNTDTVDFFTDKINNGQEISPAFISEDDEILDGHNRVHSFKLHPKIDKIYCIKINGLNHLDAARVLNKTQDMYSWEQGLENPGVEGMETVDVETNTDNNGNGDISSSATTSIEETSNEAKKTLKLYRSKPLKETSKNGNFFVLEHKPRHDHEFDVEFDNLYEMDDSDIKDNDPITSLAEMWFGNVNQVKEDAIKRVLNFDDYICEKISEEAKKRGYDGIKYGTKFLQTVAK